MFWFGAFLTGQGRPRCFIFPFFLAAASPIIRRRTRCQLKDCLWPNCCRLRRLIRSSPRPELISVKQDARFLRQPLRCGRFSGKCWARTSGAVKRCCGSWCCWRPWDAVRARRTRPLIVGPAKLPALVIRRLANRLADRLEEAAQPWHWKQRVVQLVDGTTVSMPDTPANQERYPQPRTQRPGVGFPVLRLVALLSLATAAVHDIAIGPYKGKETGETALFRSLLDDLSAGEIVLADRYYCSYFMIALLMARGIDVVFRLHQQRHYDFRRGRRLGHGDHVVVWHKPAKPRWMDAEQYAALPDTLTIREVRYAVNQPGFRVREIILATTLLDAETYSAADLADLYHQRWHTELDLRYLKTTMKMDVLRCQTPAMIERELETYILGYNVVRKATVQAALLAQQAEEATRAAPVRRGTHAAANAAPNQLRRRPAHRVGRLGHPNACPGGRTVEPGSRPVDGISQAKSSRSSWTCGASRHETSPEAP